MAPYVHVNWEIRDFLSFLAKMDIELTYTTGNMTKTITPDSLELLLMRFRGVDAGAYAKESEVLSQTYGELITRHLTIPRGLHPDQLELIDEDADDRTIKLIKMLDDLGVPAWAGRPTCVHALNREGLPVPKTSTLARAVKFRKLLYEAASVVPGQFVGNDPRNRHNMAARQAASTGEKNAIAALMAKLRGSTDDAQD